MRFKISLILFAFLCGTVLFMFCGREAGQLNFNQTEKQIMERIEVSKNVDLGGRNIDDLRASIARNIKSTMDRLKKLFEKDDFHHFARLMDKKMTRIRFVNNVFYNISGLTPIETFFRDAKNKKMTQYKKEIRIEFEILDVRVCQTYQLGEVLAWSESLGEYVNDVRELVHIEFRFRIIPSNGGEAVENDAGSGDWDCLHRDGCQCLD